MLGWELPPHHSGGLGVACYQMCKQLAKDGVDIEFVLPYDADYSSIDFMKVTAAHPQTVEELRSAGGIYDSDLYQLNYEDGSTEITNLRWQHDQFVSNVCKLVEYSEFDVLHAHDWLTLRAAMAAKQITGKPLIVHIHATEYDRSAGGYGNPVVREIEYQGLMMADRIMAVSQRVKLVLEKEYGIPGDKIEVVHNRIDYDTFDVNDGENSYQYLEKLKSQGYRVVSNIGRLTIQKNLVNLLHAIKIVVANNPKTIFLLVGSGEQEHELIELSADLGISKNVIFVPFSHGKKWRDSYRIADLFVMPSTSEPFGITPLEAIGFGAPVLVSKQSGVSEIVQNMLKVDFWDVNEMANQITAVVQNDSLRDELHQNSHREWQKLGWGEAAKAMRDIYAQHSAGVQS
jgi:glycosyltransferase involved in cell wall biosynthesis